MNEVDDFIERDELVPAYSEFEDEFEYDYQKTKISPLDVLKKFEKELTIDLYTNRSSKKRKFTKIVFFDYYSGAYF
ncbi:MAG TPA: hypothetical protein VIK86_09070 [Candidatus Paceibacterota bacterium]